MTTIDALIEYMLARNAAERVADLRIGLGYTAVLLTSGTCGVAGMLRHRLSHNACSLLSQAGTLIGTDVNRLIPLLRSSHVVETSIGLAVVNALAAQQPHQFSDENFFDLLHIRQSDVVGIVGYIEPIVKEIRGRAKEVVVFDEAKTGLSDVCDTNLEQELLPQCDVVILSATSLLNNTFDALVTMSSHARDICVMGPSTPLLPEVFQQRGVTVLAGRHILDSEKVLQIVSEAGGTKRFGNVTRKVILA